MAFLPASQAQLASHARENGEVARSARQVWKRLERLLPNRLRSLQTSHELFRRRGSRTRALLYALTDPVYAQHVDELLETSTIARKARIEYETALMMIEAHRTLRYARRQRHHQG